MPDWRVCVANSAPDERRHEESPHTPEPSPDRATACVIARRTTVDAVCTISVAFRLRSTPLDSTRPPTSQLTARLKQTIGDETRRTLAMIPFVCFISFSRQLRFHRGRMMPSSKSYAWRGCNDVVPNCRKVIVFEILTKICWSYYVAFCIYLYTHVYMYRVHRCNRRDSRSVRCSPVTLHWQSTHLCVTDRFTKNNPNLIQYYMLQIDRGAASELSRRLRLCT